MPIKKTTVVIAVFMMLLTFTECKKESETISDADFYEYISRSLVDCYVSVYNQNVAGYSAGPVDKTVSGPLGGTIHITGSTTASSSMTTTDLLFSLTNVPYVYQSGNWKVNVTLTGDVTYNGSFYGSYTSVNHQSTNLSVLGTVLYKETTSRSIDMTGNVSISRSSNSTNALIFGHTVSY